MIDTHVHFNSKPLYSERQAIMDRAEAEGVHTFVVIGYDLASSRHAVRIADEDHRCFAAVGIHPSDAAHWNEECAVRLREWSTHPRVVAIGEIGMDFYTGQNQERTIAPSALQESVFCEQLKIAAEANLPVVIHCREAYPETLAVLEREAGNTRVILHCFAGTKEEAERAFSHNWYLGIGGTVTYKKNDDLRDIVRAAPESLLLLETDAPWLSPEPFRGKHPNTPERLPVIARKIADVRGTPLSDITALTTGNARRVFCLPDARHLSAAG